MRLGTSNSYDTALQNLYARQNELSNQQEKLTSAKNINRPSDDPAGAARAERDLTRITRVSIESRSLDAQRGSITLAESTLGDATDIVQKIRDLVVTAGNGAYNATDRRSMAQEMRGLRDQLFSLANRADTNGVPLFGALGSIGVPFSDTPTGVVFNGVPGQRSSTDINIPATMDGQAIWMNVPSGNGNFSVALPATNTGTLSTDIGQVITPAALTGNTYKVTFKVVAGVTTYDVLDTTTAATIATAQPYVDGQAIQFGGMSFIAHGAPANGDVAQISPSPPTNMFKVVDDAIAGIDGSPGGGALSQSIQLSLTQLDAGADRLRAARGQAGAWLNRADNIDSAQQGRSVQLSADKSKIEDLDMVKGISDFQKFQTGYQAALQSYAQIQKLSLFNFIN